jgi:hypothetical protein
MPPDDVVPIAGPPSASIAVSDAAALLAANSQLTADLAAARARAASLEQADRTAHKTAAIAEALAGAPLISKGAAAQLTALFEKEITITTDPSTGRQVAVGPGLIPAQSYIESTLKTNSDFAHFLLARNPGGGTGGAGAQSVPTSPTPAWGNVQAPPATMSDAVMQHAQAQARVNAPSFGVDLSKPFGIPKR